MTIQPIKTKKITKNDTNIFIILDRYLQNLTQGSILAITSKIVSVCQGRIIPMNGIDKDQLMYQEADFYIPRQKRKHSIVLTIKYNTLIASAGIDESNGNGYYILWPDNPQQVANEVRRYLCARFSLKKVGVIITDSKTTPLRRGTTGFTLAHSGFNALNNYIGKPDIFGRKFTMTKANIADGLGAAAVLAMGEGSEQTPLAIITNIPHITFQQRDPTKKERKELTISFKEDLYAPLLTNTHWHSKNH